MSDFVHLHVHSEYSLVDSTIRIPELLKQAQLDGQNAIALTDFCNMFGMVKMAEACCKLNIKPIIGAHILIENEKDLHKPTEMLFLCMNAIGYSNLTKLLSRAYKENKIDGKPLIKRSWLLASEGLIAIALFNKSDIANAIFSDEYEIAEALLEYYAGVFPRRFYLEITRLSADNERLQKVVSFAERKPLPLVVTNAVRFLTAKDFEAHEARVAINAGYTLDAPRKDLQYSKEQSFKSQAVIKELFKDIPEALQNSVEIGKRCNFTLELGKVFLPNFETNLSIADYLAEAAYQGLKELGKESTLYNKRLEHELSVINSMGFAGYFLIVADFIKWAKNAHIMVGPGRGSGAGSLVAYCLGITNIDPLTYDLLFERFLNPERVSMPDFDIDFCMEGRDKVIEYVASRYGKEAVSQIITFGTMAAKAVIRDCGRVLGFNYGFVDKIAKLVPLELGITIEKALQAEEQLLKRYESEEDVKTLIDLASKLEGIARNAGKHAGGVVIAPGALTDFTPIYCDDEGSVITQLDKNDVESIGLVKFDFLGLRTLTIIDWTLKNIDKNIDINKIPLNDAKTYQLLQDGHTTAVFQLESRGMKELLKRLKPDHFEDIIALVALFRPGPLQSGMVDDFINRKHKRAQPEYLHPHLEVVLTPTYGIILYQEQVMQIAQILAGYTLGAADLLRRAMGKKKPEEMALQRSIFVQGATERGVDAARAEYIFDLMEKFAGYGFNKSHSAAYALITYQTAWLKTHYPAEFMAAVLSSDMNHTDKVLIFVEECKRMNIKVLPPQINYSLEKFKVASPNILYGLGAIKGVGGAAIDNIIEARLKEPFNDLFDFAKKVDLRKVNRRTIEALIKAHAFNCFAMNQAQLIFYLDDAIKAGEQAQKNANTRQLDLFGDTINALDVIHKIKELPMWSNKEVADAEKEAFGLYLTTHPLADKQLELKKLVTCSIADLQAQKNKKFIVGGIISNIKIATTKKGDRLAIINLEDISGKIEVVLFSELFKTHRDKLVVDNLLLLEGEVSVDNFSQGLRMRAYKIWTLGEYKTEKLNTITIELVANQEQQITNLINLILANPGELPIKLNYKTPLGQVAVSSGKKIRKDEALITELKSLLGDEFLSLVYN